MSWEQDSQEPLVSTATVAAWRRREQACTEVAPVLGGDENQVNGFQSMAEATIIGSPDPVSGDFAASQQAGLAAMIGLAEADAPSPPAPAVQSPPQPGPSKSLQGRVVNAASATSEPVSAPLSAIGQPESSMLTAAVISDRASAGDTKESRKRRAVRSGDIFTRVPASPLIVILTVQAILSLRLVWSNTAFEDEALYLWAGRVEWAFWIHGTAPAQDLFNPFSAYFSGSPVIYPPLGALAASIGGLAGARILSLCFMLVTTGLLYGVTRRIFGKRPALFAAALFVGTGSTQFLGAFATYDAMSLMLLALATWLGVRAAESRPGAQLALLVSAGSALALADAAKYAATLFDPIVIAVIALTLWRARGLKNGIAGTVIVLGVLGTLLLAGIWVGGPSYRHGINFTTLTRAPSTAPISGVLYVSGMWVGLVAILAIIGAATAACGSCRVAKARAWILAGAVFLASAEQARIHTITSLFKHVDFGAWFGCIVAGYALASLARAVPVAKASAAAAVSACVVAVTAITGIGLAGSHFHEWPNSSKMVSDLEPVLMRTGCPCLFAADNVVDYYLPQQTWADHFTTVYYFYYLDAGELQILHGVPAYQHAIANHYFKLIEIDPSEHPVVYGPVTRALATTSGYRLIDIIPSNIAHKPFEIWLYRPDRRPGKRSG